MRIPRLIALGSLAVLVAACGVDTTGLSATSFKKPRGNAASSVQIAEFGDLECPACKSAHELINIPLMEQYGTKVAFVYKQFPLNMHPHAMEAAQASECAADQNKFWEFVDMTYENQADMNSDAFRKWGENLKLDGALFDRCISSGIKKDAIQKDQAEGTALGVNSTPTYFINGQKIPSNLAAIGAAIDQALAQGSSMPL
jgi:protein-disulfide isomerase